MTWGSNSMPIIAQGVVIGISSISSTSIVLPDFHHGYEDSRNQLPCVSSVLTFILNVVHSLFALERDFFIIYLLRSIVFFANMAVYAKIDLPSPRKQLCLIGGHDS